MIKHITGREFIATATTGFVSVQRVSAEYAVGARYPSAPTILLAHEKVK